MNTPPLLVLAALALWGFQTGHPLLGIVSGVLVESSRITRLRWALTQEDFNRLWNLCTALFVGSGVYPVINEGNVSINDFLAHAGRRPEAIRQAGRTALLWFQWFPMIFLPFLFAQAFNDPPLVGLSTFSWWLRRQEARDRNVSLPRERLNIAYPYAAVCLLAAGASVENQIGRAHV